MTPFSILTARARLKKNTVAGKDGSPPELYKHLPFLMLPRYWRLFSERLRSHATISPPTWKHIEFSGIQKEPRAETLQQYRWIGKLDCCLKWYTLCILPMLRPSLTGSRVATFGFRPGFSCDDISAIIRQIIFLAYRWGLPLVIGTADIATAFDAMQHESVQRALLERGAHPHLVRAFLQEVTGFSCCISLPGAGLSEEFAFELGGKQGGIETPDVFNVLMEHALEVLVARWVHRGYGFHVGKTCNHTPLTHLIWADNIILFAASLQQFREMARELTDALSEIGFSWKPSSLECMLCGSLAGTRVDT